MLNSKSSFSANFCPIDSVESALNSPCIILCMCAFYEHLRAFPEQARACMYDKTENAMKNHTFNSIIHVHVDAREMLVDAHKVQKCKVWIKGFPTHNFSCILDKNLLKYVQFNLQVFFAFLQKSTISERKYAKFMKKHEKSWIFKFAYFSEYSSKLHDKLCI